MSRQKISTYIAIASTIVTVFVMLYPHRHIGPFDLGNPELEAGVLSVCMLLWMIARAGRWRSDAYYVFRSNVWNVDADTFRHNILTSVVEFEIIAGVLEALKFLLPDRHATAAKFLLDAASLLILGIFCYGAVGLLFRTPRGRRFIAKLK